LLAASASSCAGGDAGATGVSERAERMQGKRPRLGFRARPQRSAAQRSRPHPTPASHAHAARHATSRSAAHPARAQQRVVGLL
jgi:hypothetical protein